MNTAFVSTKFAVPQLRAAWIARPRLLAELDAACQHPLTLLSAAAGFGKTTLLTSWAQTRQRQLAWVSLDQEDNDPARFLTCLILALQTLEPRFGQAVLELLQLQHTPLPPVVLPTLLNELHAGTAQKILVLDDYHVIENRETHNALVFLIERLPPCMHFVLTTRVDPPLPLSRWRARAQMAELRANALRFTPQETANFMEQVMSVALTANQLRLLDARTEGWIAGLQLAGLSLRGRADTENFLSAFAGSHRFVLEFLSTEVLQQLSEHVQQFLYETSILERLSALLCDRVTGGSASQAILDELEQNNLFLIPLDDERTWYRYHPLFADVLQLRLRQTGREPILELHQRASAWYEENGLYEESITHAFAANDFAHAASLIKTVGLERALAGRYQTVLRWLERLPLIQIQESAQLCTVKSVALSLANRLEESSMWADAAENAPETNAAHEPLLRQSVRAWGAIVRGELMLSTGDLEACVEISRAALEGLDDKYVALALRVRVARAFERNGDVRAETAQKLANTIEPLQQAGNIFTWLNSITFLARLQFLQGRLRAATKTYAQVPAAIPQAAELPALVSSPNYYFGYADLLREQNQLDAATTLLAQGMEWTRGNLSVDADVMALGYVTQTRVAIARRDFIAAEATLDAFRETAQRARWVPDLAAHADALAAWCAFLQGDEPAARAWVDGQHKITPETPNFYRELCDLIRVQLTIVLAHGAGDFVQVNEWLDRLLQDAETKARTYTVIQVLCLRALALHTERKRTPAHAALKHALALAAPEGYIRTFVDLGAPMRVLLGEIALSPEHSDSETLRAYAARIVDAFPSSPARKQIQLSDDALLEPLSARETEILRLVAAGKSNQEIADTLVITVGTVKAHTNNLYGKLGVKSRTQALARAQTLGLLE